MVRRGDMSVAREARGCSNDQARLLKVEIHLNMSHKSSALAASVT